MQKIDSVLKDLKIGQETATGTATEGEDVVTPTKITEELKNEQIQAILEALPPRYNGISPDFAMLERVRKSGVLLFGGVGTGKTYKLLQVMVAHIYTLFEPDLPILGIRKLTQNVIRRMFLSVPDVLRQIKAEFDSPEAPRIVERLMKEEILFLDDLGSEKASEWVKEQLYIVLNERYNWKKPLLVTTNLTMNEIATVYGERFASRLYGMCDVIKFAGEDRRAKK